MTSQTVFVTGGAGFIGSALVRQLVEQTNDSIVNIDKLTYAGNLASLNSVAGHVRYSLEKTDICDQQAISTLLRQYRPSTIFHLAAESHVDRSIENPSPFIVTNVLGTYSLLSCAVDYWTELESAAQRRFRFIHVSTDEVYGSLGPSGRFTESSRYQPTSPYSASKAASDHLARAWFHTYRLPVIVTNSSNNFGPLQCPEKLIPLMILNAINGKRLPVYGKGMNVRDWLYVDDHAAALRAIAERGTPGESYMVGADNERTNIEVVRAICDVLDDLLPASSSYSDLIQFVEDRPGHDLRYAIDAGKLRAEVGWLPCHTFETGIRETVSWYLANSAWWQAFRPEVHEERRGLRFDRALAAGSFPKVESA
jgi:dTDP-glucose 4,6-dehydratase